MNDEKQPNGAEENSVENTGGSPEPQAAGQPQAVVPPVPMPASSPASEAPPIPQPTTSAPAGAEAPSAPESGTNAPEPGANAETPFNPGAGPVPFPGDASMPGPPQVPGAPHIPGPPLGNGMPTYSAGAAPRKGGLPKWGLWLIIGGGGAVLAVAALVVALVYFSSMGSAKHAAEQYVTALNDGDLKTANKLAKVDGDKRLAVLASDAYEKAEPATDYKLGRVTEVDGQAYAEISFKVDGSGNKASIELQKDDDGWYVSRGATFSLPTIYGSYGVDGYRLPGYDGLIDGDLTLQAYPGVYTAESPSKYLEFEEPVTFEVSADYRTPNDPVELVPTKAMYDVVDAKLKEHIDACLDDAVKEKTTSLYTCGTSAYASDIYDITSMSVDVKKYPKAKAGEHSLELSSLGEVVVTYKGKTYTGGKAGTEKVESDFSGLAFRVEIVKGEPKVTIY